MNTISGSDTKNLSIIRNSVTDLIKKACALDTDNLKILDIGPQAHNGV
jgi:hypothetical protein